MTQQLAVSVKTAGEMLSIGRTSVYKALQENRLQRVNVGRRTLITMDSIRRLATPTNAGGNH